MNQKVALGALSPEVYLPDSPPDLLARDFETEEAVAWVVDDLEEDQRLNDYEILGIFQQEDADANAKAVAFATLMARHQTGIYDLMRRRGTIHELAEDLVQQTFIRVYRELNNPDRAIRLSWESAEAWITTVSQRLHLDHLKRASTRFETPIGNMTDSNDTTSDTDVPAAGGMRKALSRASMADQTWQPEAVLEAQQAVADHNARLSWLSQRMQGLTAGQRHACAAVYMRGLSLEAAATEAEVNVGTLKSRLHRGMVNLRARSSGYGPRTAPTLVEAEAPEDKRDRHLVMAIRSGSLSVAQMVTIVKMSPEQFAGLVSTLSASETAA